MTHDDLDAPATLHAYLSGPIGMDHPEPTSASLRQLISAALRLPDGDRMSARITLDEGGSIGWTQINAIAEENGIQ